MNFRTELILNANELPSKWNSIVAKNNILLSTEFLKALQESQPKNMQNYFAAFYKDEILIGGALLQYLDFKKHEIFRESSFLNLNNLAMKFFANSILIIGNNLVTGQNGFYFDLNLISKIKAIKLLEESTKLIQQKIKKPSLILLKDYEQRESLRITLEKENIESRPLWKPMHLQPEYVVPARRHLQCVAQSGRRKAGR